MSDGVDNEVRELLAYAVGAHHGQFDAVNDDHKNGFEHRLTKDGIDYDEAKKNFNKYCFSDAELKLQFNEAAEQLTKIIAGIRERNPKRSARQAEEYEFQISLLARLLLSAVIEGDRRDTAEFMENMEFPQVEADWDECLGHIEEKLGKFSNTRPIDVARKQISDICRAAAEEEPGIFRLNVPTGAGKTLSGLRFAVAHAKAYRKKRIIFTSPLLSILDQNAKIIREFIGDDSIITEHHSNVALDEEFADELKRAQLLTENWSSPVIITTLVQLLDTLFAGKTSCIRRMHALCDSLIVIDEVQTVPNEMLSLFNTAVNFLSEVCGATIVLCSATQPCLEQTAHPMTENIKDIVPFGEELWRVFKRTQIIDKGGMRLDTIPAFIAEQLDRTDSLLVICNLKKQAAYLFTEMKLENTVIFHLSAGMCMAHRMAVISEINGALEKKRTDPNAPKVVCISTQVIEAGVDGSFGCVIRLCAGLDSVIQAAGRCNRNGELNGAADVFIINCRGEDLGMLRSIKDGKMACMSLLSDYKYHPEKYLSGLTSDEAVYAYYKKLYIQSDIGAQDMNSLYILTPDAYLTLDGENVVVKKDGAEMGRFPLHSLEQIVTFSYMGASPALMGKCAEQSKSLSFFSQSGRFLARVGSGVQGNVLLRRQQYRIADSPSESLQTAKNFITAKIFNSRWVLERSLRDHPMSIDAGKVKDASEKLKESVYTARSCTDAGSLRGVEGEAASTYFSVFDELILNPDPCFIFETRNRRPPLDCVNALLSFAYSLLANDCANALESVGLDPYVGMMHTDRSGRKSLALDLMEELRPSFADRFVLSGINNRSFQSNMFAKTDSGAVLLTDDGRRSFFKLWKSRRDENLCIVR